MRSAYLYIRVSTEEQAYTGYSQRNQHERLINYCLSQNIRVLDVVFEDSSAKTFDRPAWKRLMPRFKRDKDHRPDFLLFTRWDRFSRNIAEAYYVIEQLRRLAIEPQAIDQPLDLSIPENKIILAVYIASSEVDNDRRSLSVRQGIYKARKEGRWTAHPPLGYTFQLEGTRTKIIVPIEPEASMIKRAFDLISSGYMKVYSVYKQLVIEGLKCSKSHFWHIIHNPVYCGKVMVPANEGCCAYWISGCHQAIISESIFQKVQNVISSRRFKRTNDPIDEKLILRGFLHCPNCGHRLTGSGSKGKYSRYYYYHCNKCKRYRVRADQVNQIFEKGMGQLVANELYAELYSDILKCTQKGIFSEQAVLQQSVGQTIEKEVNRIFKAKELLLGGSIAKEDYSAIKKDWNDRLRRLENEFQRSVELTIANKRNLKMAVYLLSHPGILLKEASVMSKRELFSIFLKENLVEVSNFSKMIIYPVEVIYDLQITDRDVQPDPTFNDDAWNKYGDQLMKDVIRIERRKDRDTSINSVRGITDFLIRFTLFVTDGLLKDRFSAYKLKYV